MTGITRFRRHRAALLILREFGGMGRSYSASVVMDVTKWIDGGMKGPLPRPDCPFFRDWAPKQSIFMDKYIFDRIGADR